MARDTTVTLDEMLEAIDAIDEACAGLGIVEFERNRIVRLAVQRAIEIISEAARRLPDDVLARHPELPWEKIRAIGNVLRHEYHRVSDKAVWDVVQIELEPLAAVPRAERSRGG